MSLWLVRGQRFAAPFLGLFLLCLFPILLAGDPSYLPNDTSARPPPHTLPGLSESHPHLTLRPELIHLPPVRPHPPNSLHRSTDAAHFPVALLATWVHQTLRARSLFSPLSLRERDTRLPSLPLLPPAFSSTHPPRRGEGLQRPALLILWRARTFPGERAPTSEDEEPLIPHLPPASPS